MTLKSCANCSSGTFPMPDKCNSCSDLSNWEEIRVTSSEEALKDIEPLEVQIK